MKINSLRLRRLLGCATAGLLLLVRAALAAEPTAFALVKEGNRHVGEDAKDRVVQIRSEKSIGTLVPTIWYIVYYDPDAIAKATEVKFMAGRKESVKRPARVLEPLTGAHKEMPREKLKLDSDAILERAQAEPLLKNVTLKASQLTLERWGQEKEPAWKVRLWAAKLSNPIKNVDIGELCYSSETGKLLKNDLNINRVD